MDDDDFYASRTSSRSVPQAPQLIQHFYDTFNSDCSDYPLYYVQVPGRVNLIGEHVDYCGYSVVPMAIDQNVVVAVSNFFDSQTVMLTNLDSARYPNFTIDIADISEELLAKSPSWSNYYLCGILGARDYLSERRLKSVRKLGFQVAVSGTIPEGSGLSSSSALVTAAVMATMIGYGVNVNRHELAEISARCERYIGTAGGGMDQAIVLNAREGYAARIDFNPLTFKHFHLPNTVKFVVAQSLAVKNKAASNEFNTRVVECRLASQIIAKRLSLEWQNLKLLEALQKHLQYTLDQMIELVHEHLHTEAYTKKEVCEILSVSENELNELSLTPNTTDVQEFFLHQRALHVYQEAKRMEEFCNICENSGTASELGRLMNESHSSLRDLYQCSHPDLEELVELCRRGGALGCKLTGAGWGGCVVAMVPSESVEEFIKFAVEHFYAKRGIDDTNIEQYIFSTSPSDGARTYTFEDFQEIYYHKIGREEFLTDSDECSDNSEIDDSESD